MSFDVVTEDSPDPRAALRILNNFEEGADDLQFDVITDSPPAAKVRRTRPIIQGKADCFALVAVTAGRPCEFRELSDVWASPTPFPPPLLDPNQAGLCLAISHKICRIIGVRY